MRTQEEINYYLQDTTIKNAKNLLEIESCINNNNLHLPNNVIIHKNGITFAEFHKWFENRHFKAGDVVVSPSGNIVLISHINDKNIIFYHCILYPFNSFKIGIDCGIGTVSECSLASTLQKYHLFEAICNAGYQYNIETNTLETLKKFNISTLKPFDKVLVRDYNYEQWSTAVYSHKQYDHFVASGHFKQCIPYKGNEHLLGTSNDCDDFYKTWE